MQRTPPAGAGERPRESFDPRTEITEESFAIAPELLGMPLAGPWRRLAGILVDLALAGLLTRMPRFLLAIGAAFVFWRLSRQLDRGFLQRWSRFWIRAIAAVTAFVAILMGGVWTHRKVADFGADAVASSDAGGDAARLGPVGSAIGMLGAAGRDYLRLRDASSPAQARTRARDLVATLQRHMDSPEEFADLATELADAPPDQLRQLGLGTDQVDALLQALAPYSHAPPPAPDAPGAAVAVTEPTAGTASAAADSAAADSATADSAAPAEVAAIRPEIQAHIDSLERRVEAADARADRLARQASRDVEHTGILGPLRSAADDLGVSVGWLGLYFTAFLAMWKGQTPGKRIFGMRVLRLDGKPIGWWAAFERFGGYGAGIATGLLGFAQVLWDRNRQAIHDKISETVVVDESPAARRSATTP